MPFNYEKPLTQWGDPGSEPPLEMRTWLAGQKPPAGWFNWMWDACQKCFVNISDFINKQTINPVANVPTGETELVALVNGLANRIIAITGETIVQADPAATIKTLNNLISSFAAQDPLGSPKPFFGTVIPIRHLWADGKTIGDPMSNATALAHDDSQNLFNVLWSAPGLAIYESTGALSARGASAEADWNSHKGLALPKINGRTLIGCDNLGGTSANVVTNANADVIGGIDGEERHTLTINEMPSHHHGFDTKNSNAVTGADSRMPVNYSSNQGMITYNTGGGQSHNIMQPWIACNWIIRY